MALRGSPVHGGGGSSQAVVRTVTPESSGGRKRKADDTVGDDDSVALDRRCKRMHAEATDSTLPLVYAAKGATDASGALCRRMRRAVELYQLVENVSAIDAAKIVNTELHLVVKLADALVHTAYFPLQQLFFVCLSKLLRSLSSSGLDQSRAALKRFSDHWQGLDPALSTAMPLDHLIYSDSFDQARRALNALNRRLNICRACNIRKCRVSTSGQGELRLITVDPWLDLGDTTATFYRCLPRSTQVYNIPYLSIEKLELNEQQSTVMISAKKPSDSQRLSLIEFHVAPGDFKTLADVLVAVVKDGVEILFVRSDPAVTESQRRKATRRTLQHEFDEGAAAKDKSSAKESHLRSTDRRLVAAPCESSKDVYRAPEHQHECLSARGPSLVEASEERPATSLQSPVKAVQLKRLSPAGRLNEEVSGSQLHDDPTGSPISDEGAVSFEKLGRFLDRRLSATREIIRGSSRRLSETCDPTTTARLQLSAGFSSTCSSEAQVESSECEPPENQVKRSIAQQPIPASTASASKTYRVCLIRQSESNKIIQSSSMSSCPPHGIAALALVGLALTVWALLLVLARIDGTSRREAVLSSVEVLGRFGETTTA